MRPFSIAVVIALLCSHFVLAFPSPTAGAHSRAGSPMDVDGGSRPPSPMDVDGGSRPPSPMDVDPRPPSPMDVDSRPPSPMHVDGESRPASPMNVHGSHSSPMRGGHEGPTRNRNSSPPKNQHALGTTRGGHGGAQRRPSTDVRKGDEAAHRGRTEKNGHPTPHGAGRPPRHANEDRSKNRVHSGSPGQRPSRGGQRTGPQSHSPSRSTSPGSRRIKRF